MATFRSFPLLVPACLLLVLVLGGSASPTGPEQASSSTAELRSLLEEVQTERQAMEQRVAAAEKELKALKETPKVAFAASLGGNGVQRSMSGSKKLIYREVLTNVGGAYNPETGEFRAPVRGVYYVRYTANGPSDATMSAVLYKNDEQIQLIVHEQPSGQGSDTGANGAALLLERGDTLTLKLWHDTQIYDNSNHHSTFSGFLLFTVESDGGQAEIDPAEEQRKLRSSLAELQKDNLAMEQRVAAAEKELKALKETPKVAFAASLGGNGVQKSTSGSKKLIYREVLTNVGGAYNPETGEFRAPVRGVYYVRYTANGPSDATMSAVLYKNDEQIQLIVHEQPSGQGSDTGANGAALLLERGDTLTLKLWHDTQIYDNSNHHSTFSGFLLFTV